MIPAMSDTTDHTTPLIALATCRNLPDWEVDDAPFHDAIERAGMRYEQPVWNDTSVDWSRFDACIIRTTWDYTEHLDDFLAWIERVSVATTLWNPADVILWNARKDYLQMLGDEGVPMIPTRWWERRDSAPMTPNEIRTECESLGPGVRFITKPMVGASAVGSLPFRLDDGGIDAAAEHLAEWLPRETMMLQPFYESVFEIGERSLIYFDGVFSHGVRKVPKAGDYRVQDDYGAHDEVWIPSPEDLRVAALALRGAADLVGADADPPLYARVDLLPDDDGLPRLIELELIEPSLFLRHGGSGTEAGRAATADRLVAAILRRLQAIS